MKPAPKTSRRRRHVERPDIKASLIDAADMLIREEGYAAATARKIASKVGLKHQAIFYYFGSQDELLVEVFRRAARLHRVRLEAAMGSDRPISALWNLIRDPGETRFVLEFMALANHNEAIRAEIACNAEEVRAIEAEAIERYLKLRGIEPRMSPNMVSILTNGVARLLVQEGALGIMTGHDEIEALVDESFRSFEVEGRVSEGVEPAIIGPVSSAPAAKSH